MKRSLVIEIINKHVTITQKDRDVSCTQLFPTLSLTVESTCMVQVQQCQRTDKLVMFNTQHGTFTFACCQSCYLFSIQHIIRMWNRDALLQRILRARQYRVVDMVYSGTCNRCGLLSTKRYKLQYAYVICDNCYECAFGNKCMLVIKVISRAIHADVSYHIAMKLHQLYMPNYNNINEQVKRLFSM